MKKKNKIIIALLIVMPVFVVISFYSYVFLSWSSLVPSQTEIERERKKLIYETDHYKLLSACRSLIDEAREGKWRVDRYCLIDIRDCNAEYKEQIKKFPKEILGLKPTCVIIMEDKIRIEMYGGILHLGLIASYTDQLDKDYEKFFGNKKLIDGLWYYDDGYRKNPEFEKYIESLRPKSSTPERFPAQE